MNHLTILLSHAPPELRDSLQRSIREHPGFRSLTLDDDARRRWHSHYGELVGSTHGASTFELLHAIATGDADAVIVPLAGADTRKLSERLLAEHPDLLVVALSPEGDRAIGYRRLIEAVPLDRGPLLDAIIDWCGEPR